VNTGLKSTTSDATIQSIYSTRAKEFTLPLRKLTSVLLLFAFPLALVATDKPEASSALVHAHGKVELNGAESPSTIALFTGDWVQTRPDSVANIVAEGSSVLVMPNAAVKYQGSMVELGHGDVVISTSRGLATQADGVTVRPAAQKESKYEIAENDSVVVIAARKGDLTVTEGDQTSTVQEGEQSTHSRRRKGGAIPAASGAPISGKTSAIIAGAAGAAAVGAVLATTGGKHCPEPLSPSKPGSGPKQCP
jgi:hypothetical protein